MLSNWILRATSDKLIALTYSNAYAPAAYPLSILILGMALLAIVLALSAIVQGYEKPGIPTAILSSLLVLDICLHMLLIPRYELLGAAIATTTTSFVAVVFLGYVVFKMSKVLIDPKSLFKIIIGSTSVYLLALTYSFSGVLLLLYYIVLLGIYFLVLLLLKEIDNEDILFAKNTVVGLIKRKAGN